MHQMAASGARGSSCPRPPRRTSEATSDRESSSCRNACDRKWTSAPVPPPSHHGYETMPASCRRRVLTICSPHREPILPCSKPGTGTVIMRTRSTFKNSTGADQRSASGASFAARERYPLQSQRHTCETQALCGRLDSACAEWSQQPRSAPHTHTHTRLTMRNAHSDSGRRCLLPIRCLSESQPAKPRVEGTHRRWRFSGRARVRSSRRHAARCCLARARPPRAPLRATVSPECVRPWPSRCPASPPAAASDVCCVAGSGSARHAHTLHNDTCSLVRMLWRHTGDISVQQ